jgi:hypothetical protein
VALGMLAFSFVAVSLTMLVDRRVGTGARA